MPWQALLASEVIFKVRRWRDSSMVKSIDCFLTRDLNLMFVILSLGVSGGLGVFYYYYSYSFIGHVCSIPLTQDLNLVPSH